MSNNENQDEEIFNLSGPFLKYEPSKIDEFKQIHDQLDKIEKMIRDYFNYNGYTKTNGLWVKL